MKWEARGRVVALRRMTFLDITDKYLRWLNDDATNAHLSRQRWNRRQAWTWLAERLKREDVVVFAVCLRIGHGMVGTVKVERNGPVAELGVLIGQPGRGYGTEAITLGVQWVRRTWRCPVRAGIKTANARSIAAFANAGFTFEPESVWANHA